MHSSQFRHPITLAGEVIAVLMTLAVAACGAPSGVYSGTHVTPTTKVSATPTPISTTSGASATWTALHSAPRYTVSMQFAPTNPQVAYLCADDGPAVSPLTATSRLYQSTNGGQTWQLVRSAPSLHPVAPAVSGAAPLEGCRVFVDAQDAHDVFLQETELEPVGATYAIARALFRSRDGGQTWQTLTALDRTDGFDTLAVLGSRLIALPHFSVYGASSCDPSIKPVVSTFVFGSDDGGMTWHGLGQDIENQSYTPRDFATAGNDLFASADKVPATACTSSPGSALWESTNAGTTWTKVYTSSLAIYNMNFSAKRGSAGYYGVAWAASDRYSMSGISPLYSTDGGATWSVLPACDSIPGSRGSGLLVTPSGAVVGNGGEGGQVYVIRPGEGRPAWRPYAPGDQGVWQEVASGEQATLWSLTFNFSGPALIASLPLP